MYQFIKNIDETQKIELQDIVEIEKKYDIIFPDILKNYYQKYNGAKIYLCAFEIDGYEHEVSEIVKLKYGYGCFEKVKDNDLVDGFIDNNLFPLASNRGGDYYYWDKKAKHVYLIYCDNIDNPIHISNSVEEFFKLIENNIVQ